MSLHRPRVLLIDVYTRIVYCYVSLCVPMFIAVLPRIIRVYRACGIGTPYAGMYIIFTIQYLLKCECVDSYNYTFVRGQRSYSPAAAWKYVFYYYCLIEKTK